MRMAFLRAVNRGILTLAVGVVLTSCLSPAVPSQVPNPPSKLHIEITIQQNLQASASATLLVKFFDANNNFVEFAAGETIACNGMFLAFQDSQFLGLHASSYQGQVPIPPVGANYTCVYHIPDGTTATMRVPSQRPPMILSPRDGERITIPTKAHTLSIAYVPINGDTVSGSARDSMGHEATGSPEQMHAPGTYTLNDSLLSTFATGAGTIFLTREHTLTLADTGFQSVEVEYDLTSTVQMTWV